MIDNFDWTQFITFKAGDNEQNIKERVNSILKKMGFLIVSKDEMEQVKLSYYDEFWEEYVFELQNSEFLYEFGEWNKLDEPPLLIIDFVKGVNSLLDNLCIKELKIIICSFAERGKTNNLLVDAGSNDILEKLFLMCMNSIVCPDNLIIRYRR